MSVREYIGARYVPLFAEPLEWDATRTYEPLTVVLYQGNSYTSRQAVPANIPITNTTYWAQTGNYNAQIEQYRSEVQGVVDDVEGIGNIIPSTNFDTTNTVKKYIDDSIAGVSNNIGALANVLPSSNFDQTNTVKKYIDDAIALVNTSIEEIDDTIGEYVTPDDFEGANDSEKLQACFDASSTTGNCIILNREYTITTPIEIKQNSDNRNSDEQRLITRVIGLGSNAKLKITTTGFYGTAMQNNCGGIMFYNVQFVGVAHDSTILFNMNDLIRLYFVGCSFDYAKYAFSCTTNYAQDLHLVQSTFTNVEIPIYIIAASFAISAIQCMFEANLYGQKAIQFGSTTNRPVSRNVSIVDCVFEGYFTNGIEVYTLTLGFSVTGSYFEQNGRYDIFFDNNGIAYIANCYFNGGENKSAIKLPDTSGDGLPRLVARCNSVNSGYFIDNSTTRICFIDCDGTGGATGPKNTFSNSGSDYPINVYSSSYKPVSIDQLFQSSTTLSDTGISITIPVYSMVYLNFRALNYNSRPVQIAVSTLGGESVPVRNVLCGGSQIDAWDCTATLNMVTTDTVTLHIYAKYESASQNRIVVDGWIKRHIAP